MANVARGVVAITLSACSAKAESSAPSSSAPVQVSASATEARSSADAAETGVPSAFTIGTTLRVDAAVAQPVLLSGAPQSTFILIEARADDRPGGYPPTLDYCFVVDTSRPEPGEPGAHLATVVEDAANSLREGDSITFVGFGKDVRMLAPRVTLGPRDHISLSTWTAAEPDACLSCGLDRGIQELEKVVDSRSRTDVARVLLLSRSAPTTGDVDPAAFEKLGERARARAITVSTIGVGHRHDELPLVAVTEATNGRASFANDDAELAAAVKAEIAAAMNTVVARARLLVDLAPGVDVVRVMDRPSRTTERTISVPLGDFARGESKAVLIEVRIPPAARGPFKIADVRVRYGDVANQLDMGERASIGVELASELASGPPLDGVFLDRIQRGETAAALLGGVKLYKDGRDGEARTLLDGALATLGDRRAKAAIAGPFARTKEVDESFQRQAASLSRASKAPPAGPERDALLNRLVADAAAP